MTEHLLQPAPAANDRADRAEVADQATGPVVDTVVVRRSRGADSAQVAEATGCGHAHDHAAESAGAGPEVATAGRSDGFGAVSLRRHADGSEGPDPLGGTAADPGVVGALRRRRGKGTPLPTEVANPMGQALGADLSTVRVHHDAEAGHIARSVQSEAFAYGTDVYFGAGRYQPSSSDGQRLLAHELAHVTTPEAGGSGVTIGRADDPAEKAADATADRVMGAIRRSPLAPTTSLPAPAASAGGGAVVQRNILSWLKKKFGGKKTTPPLGKAPTPTAPTPTTTAPLVDHGTDHGTGRDADRGAHHADVDDDRSSRLHGTDHGTDHGTGRGEGDGVHHRPDDGSHDSCRRAHAGRAGAEDLRRGGQGQGGG